MEESILKFELRTKLAQNISEFCSEHKISRATVSGWINKNNVISSKYIRLLKGLGISQTAIERPFEIVK